MSQDNNEIKIERLDPILTDKETSDLAGTFLSDKNVKVLYTTDVDVYCKETGRTIAKFRKNIIPQGVQGSAYNALKKLANKDGTNRGLAAGWDEKKAREIAGNKKIVRSDNATTFKIINEDGTVSKTTYALPVKSNIIGYMDASSRFPFCRQTAFNRNDFNKFRKAYPMIKFVDNKYRELMPEEYARQKAEADNTSDDFVIKGTSFTTVTVNKNWQTAVHTDSGDFEGGFGNLVALRNGRYEGGYFCVPKWGCAFDLQNGDVLFVDVHQWHGNTPIKKIDANAVRISLVMYYRKNMIECGSVQEEIEKATRRVSNIFRDLSFEQFSKELLESGDIDPDYIFIREKSKELGWGPQEIFRWMLYKLVIYDSNSELQVLTGRKLLADVKYGNERRKHKRYAQEHLKALLDHYRDVNLDEYFAQEAQVIYDDLKSVKGFGKWAAWKFLDLASCCLGYDIDFEDIDFRETYEYPLKGLLMIFYHPEDITILDDDDLYNSLIQKTRQRLSKIEIEATPHNRDRGIRMNEIETLLCKYHSYKHSKYKPGQDIEHLEKRSQECSI